MASFLLYYEQKLNMKFLILISFLISLKSCNTTAKMLDSVNTATIINGTYLVETLNNKQVWANKLSINFNEKEAEISGFSGCNRFTGNYSLKMDSIKIGSLASTKMLCEDTSNQMEVEMQNALSKADRIILNDGSLQFLSENKVLLTAKKKQAKITFNYSAISRGHFLNIDINDSIVSISKNRTTKPVSKPIGTGNWAKLNSLLEKINLDSISNLKSPTEARFYDGASIGKLEIKKNDAAYESSSFDHGIPPQEIEALVKEILSLAENIE